MNPTSLAAALALLPAQTGDAVEAPAPPPIALVGAIVHTMVDGEEPRPATVLIEDRRIRALGPELEIPEGFERIELAGRHLFPGLIDGLAHHDPEQDLLHVDAGVTLIRDPGNDRSRILQERVPVMRERVPGPDLFIAGLMLDGNPPATTAAVVLDDELMAAAKLPRLLEDGVDFFSVGRGIPAGALRRAVQVAHEGGIEVWGYRPAALGFEQAIEYHMDGFFGLDAFLDEGARWDAVDEQRLAERAALAARKGIGVTPLLGALAVTLREPGTEPEGLDELGPHYLPTWRQRARELAEGVDERLRSLVRDTLARQGELLLELHAAGVAIVPGSGAPNPLHRPGQGLHDELALLADAGFEAGELIALATSGAARALGVEEQRGTLQVGMLADLVEVQGDPRADLARLRRPAAVVVRGRRLTRDELDRRRAELRELQAERLAALSRPLDVPAPATPEGSVLLEARFEGRAMGLRTQEEHVVVVREPDGTVAYCTRLESPGDLTSEDLSVELCQRFQGDRMESFELVYRFGPRDGETPAREFVVRGLRLGSTMNVERRMDDRFIDNQRARRPIDVIDVGSALTEIVMGQHWQEGLHYGLYFEDLGPVESQWTLKIDGPDRRFLVRSPDGPLVFGLDERGLPLFSARRVGNTTRELRTLASETFGGPGLELEAARRFVPPADGGAADGGAPSAGGEEGG